MAEFNSEISGKIKVWMINGKIFVDAPNANYSFGSLHKVFRKAFELSGYRSFAKGPALLLGFGAGSVPDIIHRELNLDIPITAVEIDPVMIRIASDFYKISGPNLHIIQTDAFDFVRNSNQLFQSIIVDLFIDDLVPDRFTTEPFLNELKRIVEPKGRVYFNMIVSSSEQKFQIERLRSIFNSWDGNLTEYPLMESNIVLIWEGN